jgi:hypothetical protein
LRYRGPHPRLKRLGRLGAWIIVPVCLLILYSPAIALAANRIGLFRPQFQGVEFRMRGNWTPFLKWRGRANQTSLSLIESNGLLPGFKNVAVVSRAKFDPITAAPKLVKMRHTTHSWGEVYELGSDKAGEWFTYYLPSQRLLISTQSEALWLDVVDIQAH